ncbi:MAG: polysaccharide deacetylase family protein, partial [Elusimicrobia bacterium]|nr:polysaccharide deacetylase family protein [Elusimicrobiota bacterium]
RIKTLGAAAYSSYQELHRASLLADSGHFSRAHAILTRMAADRHTLIPILLYHGISRGDRSDSIPVESFRGQMRALKQKGYQALTVSDLDLILRGKGSLPEKPILITFDDGRADSFENADPVLKEVGYRVTMFVHLSKLRKPHFHASPEDIARWHATGRWDLQAHGYEAHDPTPLDGFGRKGHFLPNRMWLTSANRLETMAEYRARVENDYRKAKDGVEAIASGVKVAAFAYPYGDYGQSDFSNTPESAAINQGLVKKYFRLAFVQEHYGINTLASNPTDLRRFEVPRYMTAEQLTAHLTLSDPRVLAKLMEATLFTRANQAGRAKAVLAELEAQGIDESAVLAAKGAAFQKTGDITYARDLFLSASERQPNKDGPAGERDRNLLTQSARAAAPVVSAEAQHGTDSETNESSKGIMRGTALYKSVRFGSWVGQGYHADRRDLAVSLPRLREREGGVQLRWFAGRRTELEGFYARREFSDGEATGPDRSFDTYAVSLSRELSPAWRLSLRNGRANVETAAAVRQSRTLQSNGAGVTWDPALNWKASADYDQSLFNDSNVERDFRLRLTKRFSERVGLGASYFRGDSKSGHPEYYTPQSLSQYTGVLTVNQLLGDINPRTGLSPADLTFQYEGGYGVQPAGRRVVHSIKGAFSLRMLDNVSLSIQGNYAQSPTYISRRGEGTLAVNF